MQTEAYNDIPDGDPEVKMEVKVCMSSLGKQTCQLLEYFQKCLDPPKESCCLDPALQRKTSTCEQEERVKT